jgi:hypothetical protein
MLPSLWILVQDFESTVEEVIVRISCYLSIKPEMFLRSELGTERGAQLSRGRDPVCVVA